MNPVHCSAVYHVTHEESNLMYRIGNLQQVAGLKWWNCWKKLDYGKALGSTIFEVKRMNTTKRLRKKSNTNSQKCVKRTWVGQHVVPIIPELGSTSCQSYLSWAARHANHSCWRQRIARSRGHSQGRGRWRVVVATGWAWKPAAASDLQARYDA